MSAVLRLLLLAAALCAAPAAHAERVISSLSTHRVLIASNFTGAELVLFGTIERDLATVARPGGYDVVITVIGPRQDLITWRKSRMFGIWANAESRTFPDAPTYLSVLSNKPLSQITSEDTARRLKIGIAHSAFENPLPEGPEAVEEEIFRSAFVRLKIEDGLFGESATAVTFPSASVFRATIRLPANVPVGSYEVDLKLFAAGALLSRDTSAFETVKIGFEQFVANAAHEHRLLYGIGTAALALFTGWLASVMFRRD